MSSASKFSSYVTIISNFFIVIINEFFTNPASATWLKLFFFFFTHDQILVKVFFHYFFTILILFKNFSNKFISSIFTSKNSNWFTRFIINTNNLVSKTGRNVTLIFVWVEPFINFSSLFFTLKININFKWDWYLFEIILKFNCSFF